jgi:hypothetical protein
VILNNLNSNIKNVNLINVIESPESKSIKSNIIIKDINKHKRNEKEIPISTYPKSPVLRKLTMGNDGENLPILNKLLFHPKSISALRSKNSLNLLNCKNVKNNIIHTLSNNKEAESKNFGGLKNSKTLIPNNKNTNSFNNNLLNKFQLNKSNDDSERCSSSDFSSSSKQKTCNSEESLVTRIETFSKSDSEEIKKEGKDKLDVNLFDKKILQRLNLLLKITIESPKNKANKRKYTIYEKNVSKYFNKEIREENYNKEVENVYGKIFGQNLEKILELRKYPAPVENQTKAYKNIERRKFAEKNYANKYICEMKEKIHFMKGLLDFTYSKIICDKVRVIGDNVKKRYLKDKLKKIKKLNENEMQEVIQFISELKYLDVGELVTDSENEEDKIKGILSYFDF